MKFLGDLTLDAIMFAFFGPLFGAAIYLIISLAYFLVVGNIDGGRVAALQLILGFPILFIFGIPVGYIVGFVPAFLTGIANALLSATLSNATILAAWVAGIGGCASILFCAVFSTPIRGPMKYSSFPEFLAVVGQNPLIWILVGLTGSGAALLCHRFVRKMHRATPENTSIH